MLNPPFNPPSGFGFVPNRQPLDPPIQEGQEQGFDWATRLSIDTIRQHTKTDDIPGVTDDILQFYRQAAIEAAEHYTGLLLSKQRVVTEPIQGPRSPKLGHHTYRHRLKFPVADGLVYIYGGPHPNDSMTLRVAPGVRTIDVPIRTGYLDLSNCCDPCNTHFLNGGMLATYKSGFASPDAVPAGIVLGMLQFLAWIIEHPGDELLTQRNTTMQTMGSIQGTNNIALASGAIEQWRQYDPEAW